MVERKRGKIKKKKPASKVMSKVRAGKKLSKRDRQILSAMADALHKKDARNSGTSLEKIMRKVAQGKKLTKIEREIISAALDAVR